MFFGAGGVRSIARTASSKVPVMGGTVVSLFALVRFLIRLQKNRLDVIQFCHARF
jgi:hypothetical protein